MEQFVFLTIIILHLCLSLWLALRTFLSKVQFTLPVWAFLAPVFGPVSALIGLRREEKGRDYTELREFVGGMHKPSYNYRIQDTSSVLSVEEILLINDNADRRKAVMDILQSKVRPYLEVLKLAATNNDMETSHYATATIMQIQDEFTAGLNQLYAAAFSGNATEKGMRDYIELLNDYISSGLPGEAMMYRQRQTLRSVTEEAIKKYGCPDLLPLHIRNLIALGLLAEADLLAEKAAEDPEASEEVLDLRLELLVKNREEKELQEFLQEVRNRRRMFSPAFRERLRFWENHPGDQVQVAGPVKNPQNHKNVLSAAQS